MVITTQRQSLTSHRANRSCGTCFVVMTTVWHALHGKNYAWRFNKSVSLTATQQSRLGAEEVRVAPSVSALVVMSRLSSSSYTFPLWTLILCSAFLIAPVQGKPMFYLNSAFSLKLKCNFFEIWIKLNSLLELCLLYAALMAAVSECVTIHRQTLIMTFAVQFSDRIFTHMTCDRSQMLSEAMVAMCAFSYLRKTLH